MKKTHEKSSCENPNRPYIIGKKQDGKMTAKLFRPDCNQWSCPHCSQRKKSEWFLHALKGTSQYIDEGRFMYMVTLTSRGGKGRSAEQAQQAFKAGWPKLRKKLEYWQGDTDYIMIPEQHRNGIMHVHLLINNILTKRWWKDNAYKSGLGYMVDVTEIDSAGAGAFYVSKYIDKHLVYLKWPKGFRRIRTSQGWPRVVNPESAEEIDYTVYSNYGAALWAVHELRDEGYEVVDTVREKESDRLARLRAVMIE